MSVVTIQYLVKQVTGRDQRSLQTGMPSRSANDVNQMSNSMDPDEEVTIVAPTMLILDCGKPLDVQLSVRNADNSISVIRRDVAGLLTWPGPCTAVVRCPARFGYTLPIPLRAVYC